MEKPTPEQIERLIAGLGPGGEGAEIHPDAGARYGAVAGQKEGS